MIQNKNIKHLIFSSIKKAFITSYKSYPIVTLSTISLFIFTSLNILFTSNSSIVQAIMYASFFAFIYSSFQFILSKHFLFSKKIDVLQKAIILLLSVIVFFLFPKIHEDNSYFAYAYFGFLFAGLLSAVFFLFTNQNTDTIIAVVLKNIFYAELLAFFFFIGSLIVLLAVNLLLFPLSDDIIIIIFLASQCFVAIPVFFSVLSLETTEYDLPKIFITVVSYILFPLFGVLLFVLYCYFIKILITLSMPVGEVNAFVTVAQVLYLFFLFTLGKAKNKIILFYKNYGGFFIIPCIIAQIFALVIRISNYGLTPFLFAGIIFSTSVLICIIFTTFTKKLPVFEFAFLACACLLTTCTPIHIRDIPAQTQMHRLQFYLQEYGFIKDNSFDTFERIPFDQISLIPFDAKKEISQSYKSIPTQLLPKQLSGEFYNLFGFDMIQSWEKQELSDESSELKNISFSSITPVNIDGFTSARPIYIDLHSDNYLNQMITIKYDYDKTYDIDVSILKEGYESTSPLIIQVNKDISIAITSFNLSSIDDVTFTDYKLQGLILKK